MTLGKANNLYKSRQEKYSIYLEQNLKELYSVFEYIYSIL